MIIINLEAENIKKIKAINVTPKTSTIVVGGKNGAGKSTVLDLIQYAMDGKSSIPGVPIKEGETEGKIVIDYGDIIVTRTFKEGGKTGLKVTSKDGAEYKKPQDMLYEKVGALSFDPLEFSRMPLKEQIDILMSFTDFDFALNKSERDLIYDKRTQKNRFIKESEVTINAFTPHNGLPAETLDPAQLYREIEGAKGHNSQLDGLNQILDDRKNKRSENLAHIEESKEQIKAFQKSIEIVSKEAEEYKVLIERSEKCIGEFVTIDTDPMIEQHHRAMEINQKIHENKAHKLQSEKLKELKMESGLMTGNIEDLDKAKLMAVENAKLPVSGLVFDSDGISFNGLPLEQASGAERLELSIGIGLAKMGEFKILLVRDASLLDDDSMALVSKMVEDAGGQCWMERISSDGKNCTLFLEDGAVVEQEVTA